MKRLFLIAVPILLFSCNMSKELQVEQLRGEITKVQLLTRYGGDLKRVEWTLEDRTKRYQYLTADHDVLVGTVDLFLVNK